MIGRKPLLDVLRALEGDKGDTYPFHLCICEVFFNGKLSLRRKRRKFSDLTFKNDLQLRLLSLGWVAINNKGKGEYVWGH